MATYNYVQTFANLDATLHHITLSRQEKQQCLASVKKKKKNAKLVLDNPFRSSKKIVPLIDESHPLLSPLTEHLAKANLEAKTESNCRVYRSSLAIGVNAAVKNTRCGNTIGVILANDVKPQTLVAHLIALCREKEVPVAYVPAMRKLTMDCLGFECIAIGFKNVALCQKVGEMLKDIAPYINPVPVITIGDVDGAETEKLEGILVLSKTIVIEDSPIRVNSRPDGFIPLVSDAEVEKKEAATKGKRKRDESEDAESDDVEIIEEPVVKYKKDWVIDKSPRYFPPKVLRVHSNPERLKRGK